MNKAPAVYVPTEPEGNGLTLPLLLSLLAHGIVLGVLIYTYQQPKLEIAGSIETTMVTPGELAEMQSQILANRAAAQAANSDSSFESFSANQNSAQPNTQVDSPSSSPLDSAANLQNVPIFIPSDEPAESPTLMSEEQHQRRQQQIQEYERNIAEFAAQLDESALEDINQVQQDKQNALDEERAQLKSFRTKQNPIPKIKQPTDNSRNIEIEMDSAGSKAKNLNLSDGQSTVSTDSATSSPTTGSARSAGGSRGTSNSEIVNLIKQNYNPPIAARGSVQQATLVITVNASGNVTKVVASGPDSAVNEAARQAVLTTRKLPIEVDDPKYPTFTLRFRGSN